MAIWYAFTPPGIDLGSYLQVVDEYSARVYASTEEFYPVGADHQDMVRYEGEDNKTFKQIKTIVRNTIEQSQSQSQSRPQSM